MIFLDWTEMTKYVPFIVAGFLIFGGIVILKIGLAIARAQSKTNFKWVAGSYLIQYGVTLFLSSPMLLDMFLSMAECEGSSCYYEGPNGGLIALAVIFSVVMVLNLINLIHKQLRIKYETLANYIVELRIRKVSYHIV